MSFGIMASAGTGATGGGSTSAYATQIMSDSPLAFYKFDETAGPTLVDSSGNSRDGTYAGTPTFQQPTIISGSTGRSVSFEGVTNGDKATVTYGSWMNATAMTIMTACFVEPQALRLVASRYTDVGTDWSWFLYTDNSTFQFYYRSSGGTNYHIDTGVTVYPGIRYFVAAYVGASQAGVRVYDENGLIASATGPGVTLNSSSRNLVLMNCDAPNYYPMTGYLDGLAYFGTALSTTRIDTLADAALSPVASKWINRTAGVAARNGTTNHTINFTPASAGSLLVAIASTGASNTAVTAGWTERLSPSGETELSIFTRSANAGDSSLQITHDASDMPMHYVVYEFPSGSAWYSGASAAATTTYPDLTGLPGTPVTVFAVFSLGRQAGDSPGGASIQWKYFWSTDFNVETLSNGVTDGVFTNVGYINDVTYTTASVYVPTTQYSIINSSNAQITMFALTIP